MHGIVLWGCSESRKEVTVLGRVGGVDQQPSGEPEVGDEGGQQQQPGNKSIVSREEKVQGSVTHVTDSGEPHGNTQVTREDSPHADARPEEEHVHASENLLKVVSVLVEHQEQVGKLGSDRRHVVRVEVLLDDFVERTGAIQQKPGSDQEADVSGAHCLLDDLEGAESDGGCGVNTGTDQDETQSDTDDGVNNADNNVEEDSELEDGHALGDFISGLFRLQPFDENPSDSNSGVDGTKD